MNPAQIAIVALGALIGVSLIVFGVRAWRRSRTRTRASRKNFHLPPAAILFGVSFLLFSANTAIVILSDYGHSLQWWFLSRESGPIAGFFSPAMVCFLLGFFVLAWWPRDPGSPAKFCARLKNPRTRPRLLWEAGRIVVTLVTGVVVMVAWLALALRLSLEGSAALGWAMGMLVVLALFGGGLLGSWLYGCVLRRPESSPLSDELHCGQ